MALFRLAGRQIKKDDKEAEFTLLSFILMLHYDWLVQQSRPNFNEETRNMIEGSS